MMGFVGDEGRMGKIRTGYTVLAEKSEEKRLVGKRRRRWEGGIKLN
jgi:hypothetical protein